MCEMECQTLSPKLNCGCCWTLIHCALRTGTGDVGTWGYSGHSLWNMFHCQITEWYKVSPFLLLLLVCCLGNENNIFISLFHKDICPPRTALIDILIYVIYSGILSLSQGIHNGLTRPSRCLSFVLRLCSMSCLTGYMSSTTAAASSSLASPAVRALCWLHSTSEPWSRVHRVWLIRLVSRSSFYKPLHFFLFLFKKWNFLYGYFSIVLSIVGQDFYVPWEQTS